MNVRIHKSKKRSVIAHVGDRCNGFKHSKTLSVETWFKHLQK